MPVITITKTIKEDVIVNKCPFCNSDKNIELFKCIDDRYSVCCKSCFAYGPHSKTQHDAIAYWNNVTDDSEAEKVIKTAEVDLYAALTNYHNSKLYDKSKADRLYSETMEVFNQIANYRDEERK